MSKVFVWTWWLLGVANIINAIGHTSWLYAVIAAFWWFMWVTGLIMRADDEQRQSTDDLEHERFHYHFLRR